MGGESLKRQKRAEYRAQLQQEDIGADVKLPKKRFYRQRAHANPFSDHNLNYPLSPAHMDWASHYPAFVDPNPSKVTLSGSRQLVKDVEVADIGCGFGGLIVALAPVMPDTLMVGMELRIQVLDYLSSRILALRSQNIRHSATPSSSTPTPAPEAETPTESTQLSETAISSAVGKRGGLYQNISAIRSNTMKFLPNFFAHHQLSKIFICFPDPHFKARKHKARIVSASLNAEYAYVLRPGGLLYTITDVEELHRWMVGHFERGVHNPDEEDKADTEKDAEKDVEMAESTGDNDNEDVKDDNEEGIKDLWERVSQEELDNDPCVKIMMEETEEGKKVTRNNGRKFVAVWRRKQDPEWA